MAKKRIGILTGGGDVPGLSIAIKSVVLQSVDEDIEIIGIRRGWLGLLAMISMIIRPTKILRNLVRTWSAG